jgi:hypothetical protein
MYMRLLGFLMEAFTCNYQSFSEANWLLNIGLQDSSLQYKKIGLFSLLAVLIFAVPSSIFAQTQDNTTDENVNGTQTVNNTQIMSGTQTVNNTQIVSAVFDSSLPIVFIVLIFLILAVPIIVDMYLAYKKKPPGATRAQGMPGLYRSLMSFGIIVLVGTIVFYLLALITLNINNPLNPALASLIDVLTNLGTILGTALATIIAFYFGIRGTESTIEKTSAAMNSPAARDNIPATVTNTLPADGDRDVSLDALVQATFSEPMNSATINRDTFNTKKADGGSPIEGRISLTPDRKTASFDAKEDFSPGTTYIATINTSAQDLAGNPLASSKSWTFTTREGVSEAEGKEKAQQPQGLIKEAAGVIKETPGLIKKAVMPGTSKVEEDKKVTEKPRGLIKEAAGVIKETPGLIKKAVMPGTSKVEEDKKVTEKPRGLIK